MRTKKKSSGGSFFGGLLCIVIGIIMLFVNEGNNVKNIKTIEEARSVMINVVSDKVDSANEGKLVATNGELTVGDEYLIDSVFSVKVEKTAKLVRIVEMYQWIEDEEEDSDGYVTYNYEKKWLTTVEDSSNFKDSSKSNPSRMPYEGAEFYSNNVSLGAFTINDTQKELLSTGATLSLDTTVTLPYGYTTQGQYITNSSNIASPNVGDVRISYVYNNDKEISVLAMQKGSGFAAYKSEAGKTLNEVRSGVLTGEEIINAVEQENEIFKWVMRLVGVLFVSFGFAALLSPIAFLAKFIPFFGKGIANIVSKMGFLIGLAVSLVVIAISWITFRPVIGLILLGIVLAIVAVICVAVTKSKNNEQLVVQNGMMQQPVMGQPQMMPQQPQMMPQQPMVQPVQQPIAQSQMMPQQPMNQPVQGQNNNNQQ